MEHAKIEVEAVQNTLVEATVCQLRELNDFQLAYVGGGSFEPTLI
jgi:hypothetical protein